jgi:quercetin dioxygenase-like cupin family protein
MTYSAPYDALLQIVDGIGIITIEGQEFAIAAPGAIIMPANKPHAVDGWSREIQDTAYHD